MRSQEKRREDRYQREDRSRVKCYKCNRFGHRSYECRLKGSEESQKGIVCYSCDQPVHKAPDCPKKKNKDSGFNNRSCQSNAKGSNLKPGEKPKYVNWVAVTSTSETIPGKVNGFTTDLVVDTGAEITVIPGNLVYEGQILPDTVEIVGATGVPVSAKTARVEFEVEGITFDKVVAVASPGMMCERVLYSVYMPKNKAMQLLVDACKSEAGTGENFVVHDKPFVVNENPEVRVVTRNQKKKAEVVEAAALVQDRAGVIVKSAQGKEKTNGKEETLVPKPIGREVFMGQHVVNSPMSGIHSDLYPARKWRG